MNTLYEGTHLDQSNSTTGKANSVNFTQAACNIYVSGLWAASKKLTKRDIQFSINFPIFT
jgi:hypothetical protein